MTRLAVVTVTFNSEGVLRPFMACLAGRQGVEWHLYLIDNDSGDDTRSIVAELSDPRVTPILNVRNRGVAAANNQGIERALADGFQRIVLMNNDTEFASDLLEVLSSGIESSGADAISPLVAFFDRPDLIWYGGGSFRRFKGIECHHDHWRLPIATIGSERFVTRYAPTCCVLFRSDVFRRIGTMDEAYFVYWDDTDFMWRMQRAGMTLVVEPGALLLHKISSSTGGRLSDFSIRYHCRNQVRFARKFHGWSWVLYTAAMSAARAVWWAVVDGESLHHLRLRLAAIREGLSMPRDEVRGPGRS